MKAHKPRSGSMQFWPRVRAKKEAVRARSWAESKDAKPLGFAGYKVGMTHVLATETYKNSHKKGMKVRVPVTIIECPDIKVIGVRFYKKTVTGVRVATEIEFKSDNKRLADRKIVSKKAKADFDKVGDVSEYADIRLLVHTSPDKTTIGKKIPDIFELGLGGNNEEKLAYAKDNASKDISIADVFAAGDIVDTKAVTTGKGFQGPVKRFGVTIRGRKSEKTKRGPGSLGPWKGHGHFMYRVAHAGQMGYHARTEYNKLIMKISDNPEEVNPKGGFIKFGEVKGTYVMIYGSVNGPKKRLVRFNKAIRPNKRIAGHVPAIESISKDSQQGN